MAAWKSAEQCEPGLIAACLQGTFGLMMLTVRKRVPAAPFRKGIHTLVLVMQEHQVRKAVVEPKRPQIRERVGGSESEAKREIDRKREKESGPFISIQMFLFPLAHLY